MWADRVDQWIKENEEKKGNPELGGMAKLYGGLIWFTIHLCTFGISLVLKYKFLDANRKPFYHQYIYSRDARYKISDPEAQTVLKTVLEQEAVELKDGEEPLFIVSSDSGIGRKAGLVFTTDRLIYVLQDKVVKATQGTILLTELGSPKVKKNLADNCVISFGEKELGAVAQFLADDLLLNFLRQIKLALG